MSRPTVKSQRLNAAKMAQYATQIYGRMEQRMDVFPDPNPPLQDLETAIANFRDATTEAAFRDTRAIKIRNQRQKALEKVLYELAKYVDTVAQGDPAMVLAAGFVPAKSTVTRHGRSPRPQKLLATPEYVGSGTIQLRTEPWAGALMYQFESRIKNSGDDWEQFMSSKSTCRVPNLESLKEYEFRVAYRGADPEIVYSAVVTEYVL